MMRKDIMRLLNKKAVGYNLQWDDVMYDADNAIYKINHRLGTMYPPMSQVMVTDETQYAYVSEGVVRQYFPVEHIHSVVLNFMAMEVLARDEEFTTIYNKYAADFEEGLFVMVNKEFNRIPFDMRENPDQGVFFGADSALAQIRHNNMEDIPEYKFKVFYHMNNEDIMIGEGTDFVTDLNVYKYNDIYKILGWDARLFNIDYTKAFTFLGWSRNIGQVTDTLEPGGDDVEHIITSDVHYYAKWSEEPTLEIDSSGAVNIKDDFIVSMQSMVIPDIVSNKPVNGIKTHFLRKSGVGDIYSDEMQSVVLPRTLMTIEEEAFKGFKGDRIVFPDAINNITIHQNAFMETPNLENIVIPLHVTAIVGTAFPVVPNKTLNIYVRRLQDNVPAAWDPNWYAQNDPDNNYYVNIIWGYNG